MSINAIKEDEHISSVSKKDTLVRLFKYLLAYRSTIFSVILIMLTTVAISIINPLLIERAIDVHIANKDIKRLLMLIGFALGLNIIFILLVKLRMYLMAKMSNDVLLRIRQELYTHIQKLSFNFFDSRPTGKILARIIGDVNSLKDVLSDSVTTLIPDFVTIVAVVIIMLVKNWRLALASLISLPLMLCGLWFIETRSHVRWRIHRKKSSNLNAFIHESLSGIRIIQSFTAENETEEDFDHLLKEHRGSFISAILINNAFFSVVDISWGLGTIAMYFVAVKVLGIGAGNVGTLISFGMYIGMFWRPIMNLSNFYNKIITNISGAEKS